ncbi:hypothetical protein N7520_004201 [Penicillium odoratum]|uniref:uncharacterized protein n=1 Tax=Penicillium odoratum TaxID=1167516 RepID=UPI0025478E5D|nr:uncharacterized protein N7520_004201 [Penicillium odoratum]KAJ5769642.1 hypothetical protein N7520_004201 [Penicillium odoratum]
MDSTRTWKYGKLQKAGCHKQNELDDPRVLSKVTRSELTYQDLESRRYIVRHTGNGLDATCIDPISQLGLPTEIALYHNCTISRPATMAGGFLWKGCIGPGLIILEDIVRTSNHLHISQVAQAVYAKRFDIQGLKHIFVVDIIYPETVAFVGPNLYGEDADPWFTEEYPGVQLWEHNTDEYQGLLGTPLGKVAASGIGGI